MKTKIVSLFLAVLTFCFAGFTASAQNSVPRQQRFNSINELLSATRGGQFHNLRIYACKANSTEMCLSGRPMTRDEAVNFFNSLPRDAAECKEKGLPLTLLQYCGGCYAVWEEERQVATPPAKQVVDVEEDEPEVRKATAVASGSKSFIFNLLNGISLNLNGGYNNGGYCPPVYRSATVVRGYCEPRSVPFYSTMRTTRYDSRCNDDRGFVSTLRQPSRSVQQRTVVTNTNVNRNYNSVKVSVPRQSSQNTRPSTRSTSGSRPVSSQGSRTKDPRRG